MLKPVSFGTYHRPVAGSPGVVDQKWGVYATLDNGVNVEFTTAWYSTKEDAEEFALLIAGYNQQPEEPLKGKQRRKIGGRLR